MKITTSELVYINEAAKALKQKDFIIINNALIGIDNIETIVVYTLLDTNFINNYYDGIIINQRSLSAFIKTLLTESEFEFDFNNIIKNTYGTELQMRYNQLIKNIAYDKFNYALSLENNMEIVVYETEIPDIMEKIYNMKSGDGAVIINYNNYYMTLFSSLLPLTKTDKLYVTIFQPIQSHLFISKFIIKKKKFNIILYINYLKI